MGIEGAGLAYLVSSTSTPAMDNASLPTVLSYVYDTGLEHACEHDDVDYPQLVKSIERRVSQISSADVGKPSSSSGATASNGRLGPGTVAVDRSSVCGSFSYSSDNFTIESLGNFSSCRANVAVYAGKWMYECTVLTPGIQQIGWATIHCPFTAEEGVGDAPDSYAVDGKRMRKWNVKPQPYGEPWVQGDVMGCCLDLDAGTLTFFRNGQSLGIAYDRVRTMQPSLAYFPAVSLSHTERCTLNFGAKPFVYPIQGYQALQAPPSAASMQEAAYYCACLSRLCLIAADRQEGLATAHPADSSTAGRSAGTKLDSTDLAAGVTLPGQQQPQSAAAAGAISSLTYAASSSPRTAVTAPVPPFTASVSIPSADVVLLAAVVLDPLQQLLVNQPYLIHSALLPVLGEAQRENNETQASRQLQLMLQLLMLVWNQEFNSIMFAVLEELAYRCQVSPLLVQDFPYTAGYPHLALAVSLLQHPHIMRLFVAHPDYTTVMEGLLTRKSPSPKDLQTLLPHVWWKGCKDETASEERLRASVSIITATLAKVEQRQYDMLELLLATPFQDPAAASSRTSRDDDDDCALMVFLRFLLQKNRGALRDVPPPGLSESTVLMTTFFGLLRLLQPALQAAVESGAGPLAAFPASELLAAAGAAAEASPVFDVPRLGGTVSFLAREHPLSDIEQQPIPVGSPQSAAGGDPAASSSGRDSSSIHQEQSIQQQQRYVAPAALNDAWVPELLNTCMLLYCWRVGFNYKMIHTLSSSVVSSSTTLEDLDRMIANSSGADPARASTWLVGTRKVYHDELTRDVRLLTLLRVAFFSPGKQAALCNLTSYLATLVTTISNIPPPSKSAALAATEGGSSSQAAEAAGQQQQQHSAANGTTASSYSSSEEAHLSNLLRYLPVVYVEVIVDYLTALRRCDEQSIVLGDSAHSTLEAAGQGSRSYVAWLCGSLNDPRVANPDVQESMLQVCGLLLDHTSWRTVVEAQPERARQLIGSLLQVFDSRLWHPASGVLLKVIRGCGFGHKNMSQIGKDSLQQVLLDAVEGKLPAAESPAGTAATSLAPAGSSSGAAAADPSAVAAARTKGFLNRLFNTLNWTLTEFTVCVGDLHNLRGRRSILEAQNQYRRTGLMFELSVNFMRILEFVVPTQAFLGSAVNRTRLRELLQFVLSHNTNGPDARRLNELLQASQPAPGAGSSSGGGAAPAATAGLPGAAAGTVGSPAAPLAAAIPAYAASAMQFESNSLSERVQKPALLAPVMGILLAVWEAHRVAVQRAAQRAGVSAVSSDDLLLQELAQMADERFMSALQFMKDVDWCAFFHSCPLSGPLRAFDQLLDALAAARVAHETSAASNQLPEDVPDEFLDPITMDIMHDPVKLPDSQIVVDRTTIERHLLSSETDPFSRAPLTSAQLFSDTELKTKMQQWLAQCQQSKQP